MREVKEETGLDVVLLNEEKPDYEFEPKYGEVNYIIRTSAAVTISMNVNPNKEDIVSKWFSCSGLLAGSLLQEKECIPSLNRVLNIAI